MEVSAELQRCRDSQVSYATLLLEGHPEQHGLRQALADEFAEDLILSGLWGEKMIEHERVLAAMQAQADTIARLERELAEARAKIEGLTVDEDWTKDDHVAMVNEANEKLQAFADGLESNLAAVIQRAESAEEALRAMANANANRAA
jgi:hypothetical protein